MTECKPSPSPASVKPAMLDPDPIMSEPHWYRITVGSLQYLTLTRPEITFVVNYACQHMHAPHQSHFVAVKRILRYIKSTNHQGLLFTLIPSHL